jgi:cation:H+ antiporter
MRITARAHMILIIIGIILLYFGAESLVKGSSRLAANYGIPPLIIGLTIVAFGTSCPELVVSLSAALKGSSDVAVGNIVGSNIFNIAFILGITALIRPPSVHIDFIRREIPIMIFVSIIGLGLIYLGYVSRISGIVLFSGLIAYVLFSIKIARKQTDVSLSVDSTNVKTSNILCVVFIIVGLALLVAGSHLFVTGAVKIAVDLGISQAVIGLTIVAAGTSLPELATSVVAAIKKESDVAIGNIVGSNIFNILGILGLTAVIKPLNVVGINMTDGMFMLGLAVILLPFAFIQKRIARVEGTIFLSIYGAYLYILWPK